MTTKATATTAFILVASPAIALAGPDAPTAGLVAKYPDLFAWVVGLLLAGILALLALKIQADAEKARADSRNNEKQWQHIEKTADGLSEVKVDVAELRGAHEANHPQFRREFDYAPVRRD